MDVSRGCGIDGSTYDLDELGSGFLPLVSRGREASRASRASDILKVGLNFVVRAP